MKRILVWLFPIVLAVWAQWATAQTLPRNHPVPGGIAVVPLTGPTPDLVKFGDRMILSMRSKDQWYGIVGISLDTPLGDYIVTTYPSGESPVTDAFPIHPYHYDVTQDVASATGVFDNVLSDDFAWRDVLDARFPFVPPTRFRFGGGTGFGTRNIHNDLATPAVDYELLRCERRITIVRAPAAGVVARIDARDPSRRILVIDHGMGLYTILAPLTRTVVEPGQRVEGGSEVGFLDATESKTNLLAWRALLNGAAINPWLLTGQRGDTGRH